MSRDNIWGFCQILPKRAPETPETFKGYAKLGHMKLVLFRIKISAWFAWIHGHPATTKYEFPEKVNKSETIFIYHQKIMLKVATQQ